MLLTREEKTKQTTQRRVFLLRTYTQLKFNKIKLALKLTALEKVIPISPMRALVFFSGVCKANNYLLNFSFNQLQYTDQNSWVLHLISTSYSQPISSI